MEEWSQSGGTRQRFSQDTATGRVHEIAHTRGCLLACTVLTFQKPAMFQCSHDVRLHIYTAGPDPTRRLYQKLRYGLALLAGAPPQVKPMPKLNT